MTNLPTEGPEDARKGTRGISEQGPRRDREGGRQITDGEGSEQQEPGGHSDMSGPTHIAEQTQAKGKTSGRRTGKHGFS